MQNTIVLYAHESESLSMSQAQSQAPVKIAKPFVNDEIVKVVEEIISSGQLVQGKRVKEFESRLTEYIGCKYVIAVNSGTAALHAAILSCREGLSERNSLPEEPKVLTTPLSFAATANAVLHARCTPIFADVDPETFNISPQEVEEAIDQSVIAVEPVDVYGLPADLGTLSRIARKTGAALIEDAAEAIGATYNKRRIGAISDLTCFSTYATKNLHTGEGGFITTNDADHARRLEMIRSQGQSSRYNHITLGYNFRMTEIAAAIGIPQVALLDDLNSRRRKNAEYIREGLSKKSQIRFQKVDDPDSHAWYMLSALLDEPQSGMNRDIFVKKLREKAIEADVSWPTPIHLQPYYKAKFGYKEGDYPVAESICKSIFQLPIQPFLKIDELDRIVSTVSDVLHS